MLELLEFFIDLEAVMFYNSIAIYKFNNGRQFSLLWAFLSFSSVFHWLNKLELILFYIPIEKIRINRRILELLQSSKKLQIDILLNEMIHLFICVSKQQQNIIIIIIRSS